MTNRPHHWFHHLTTVVRYQGLTRNGSPVYLSYPPDRSGRRPSEHTLLQYASPTYLATTQGPESARCYRATSAYQQNDDNRNRTSPQRTTGNATTRVRRGSTPVVRGGGDYTSSGSSNSTTTRPRTQPTRTRYWYCCTPGCHSPGPYIESLYGNCVLGCGALKCPDCRREIVSLRDREPANISPARIRRS